LAQLIVLHPFHLNRRVASTMSDSVFELTREGPVIAECPIIVTKAPRDNRLNVIEWLLTDKTVMSEFKGDCSFSRGVAPKTIELGQDMSHNQTEVEKMAERIHNMPLDSELCMLVDASDAGLFAALKSVLGSEGEGVVTHVNQEGSHLKAYAVEGCHLVDVEVQVLQLDNVMSKAVFFQLARTDTVRLSRVFQRAAASLRFKGFSLISPRDPAGQGPFVVDSLDEFDDDFDEICGDDDHEWASALLPLIEQAQSVNVQRKWEAAVLLAETAQASPGCRACLAGFLGENPETLDSLLSMGASLPIQFAAAKMLAFTSLCTELPALASHACSSIVGARLLSGASALVRGPLLQAARNFRVNEDSRAA